MEQQAIQRGQGRVNQLGGSFINGRPLPPALRIQIVKLSNMGMRPSEISTSLRVSHGCVTKILQKYHQTGTLQPKATGGSKPRVCTAEVKAKVVIYLEALPSMFGHEIRARLVEEGVCSLDTVPSLSSITRVVAGLRGEKYQGEDDVTVKQDPESQTVEDETKSCRRRQRSSFTNQQVEELEKVYQTCQYPDISTKERLADATGLTRQTVQIWFSNRRAKSRKLAIAATPTAGPSNCMWNTPVTDGIPQCATQQSLNAHHSLTEGSTETNNQSDFEPISPALGSNSTLHTGTSLVAPSVSRDWTSPQSSSCATPQSTYQTPHGSTQTLLGTYQTPHGSTQTSLGTYQTPHNNYQTPHTGYQTPQSSFVTPQSSLDTSHSGHNSSPDQGYYSSSPGFYSPQYNTHKSQTASPVQLSYDYAAMMRWNRLGYNLPSYYPGYSNMAAQFSSPNYQYGYGSSAYPAHQWSSCVQESSSPVPSRVTSYPACMTSRPTPSQENTGSEAYNSCSQQVPVVQPLSIDTSV